MTTTMKTTYASNIMVVGSLYYYFVVVVSISILQLHHQPVVVVSAVAVADTQIQPAERKLKSKRNKRPNFIVIQPDDHYFFEEWNPPGRFFDIDTDDDDDDDDHETNKPGVVYSNGLTPNIDFLRQNGIEMTNAYAGKEIK